MVVRKAGAYPSEAPFKCSTLGLVPGPYPQKLMAVNSTTTLSIMIHSIATLSIMTLSIMTFSITIKNDTISIATLMRPSMQNFVMLFVI